MSEITEQTEQPERLNVLQAMAVARTVSLMACDARRIATINSHDLEDRGDLPCTNSQLFVAYGVSSDHAEHLEAIAERRYAAILSACEGIEFDSEGNRIPSREEQRRADWLESLGVGDPVMECSRSGHRSREGKVTERDSEIIRVDSAWVHQDYDAKDGISTFTSGKGWHIEPWEERE